MILKKNIVVSLVLFLSLAGYHSPVLGGQEATSLKHDPVPVKIVLPGVESVQLDSLSDGSYRFVVKQKDQPSVFLNPDEFARFAYDAYAVRTLLERILNISSPAGIAWVVLGFLGQLLFTGRMVLQWLVSERQKRSVVPVVFWWLSLAGGMMLLIYFSWRKDIIGILGQSTGVFIYSRNLALIYRKKY